MLTLHELRNAVESYRNGEIDFDEFEDWFRAASRGLYESFAEVRAIESSLSKFHFHGISETLLYEELANAVRPFAFPRLSPRFEVALPPLEVALPPQEAFLLFQLAGRKTDRKSTRLN